MVSVPRDLWFSGRLLRRPGGETRYRVNIGEEAATSVPERLLVFAQLWGKESSTGKERAERKLMKEMFSCF